MRGGRARMGAIPELDPDVSDETMTADTASYDERHHVTYLRLLNADAEGAN